MEVLIICTCLGILLQFDGLSCNKQEVDCEIVSDTRLKRNHEPDKEKTIVKPLLNLLKPAPVKKEKLTDRRESKNSTNLNNILKEISSLAKNRNDNETKDIEKIRLLVDEIDKQNKNKINVPKVSVLKLDKNAKKANSSKEPVKTKLVINEPKNTTKSVDSTDKVTKGKVISKISSDGDIETKEIEATDGRRSNIKIGENSNQNLNKNNLKKENAKNDLIEIKEHSYEEELLHAPVNTYKIIYSGGNYYPKYATYLNRNGNNFGNFYNYPLNYPNLNGYYDYNYPRITYGSYYNTNGYYYDIFNEYTQKANIDSWKRFITGIRKTWLDRNTIIRSNVPYRYLVNVNEDGRVTKIPSPDYKYCSVMQKLYPSAGLWNNLYYSDPCHCS